MQPYTVYADQVAVAPNTFREVWLVEAPNGYVTKFSTQAEAQAHADARNQSSDAAKIADAFGDIYKAAMLINEILGRNDKLNESVPKNWPLALSADEFAAACQEMAWHYETLAGGKDA